MTADPSRSPEQAPAWWVVTTQGVPLDGPHATREDALSARRTVVTRMRESMAREHLSGAQIAAQTGAVVVAHGVLTGPWRRFESR